MQLELKLAVAAVIGKMHVSLDAHKMSARSPEALMKAVLGFITLDVEGGVHLVMSPRAQCSASRSQ